MQWIIKSLFDTEKFVCNVFLFLIKKNCFGRGIFLFFFFWSGNFSDKIIIASI